MGRKLVVSFAIAVAAGVAAVCVYILTPSHEQLIVRNVGRHSIAGISVRLSDSNLTKRHALLRAGESWQTSLAVTGDGHFVVHVDWTDRPAFKYEVGYVTHGMTSTDTLLVRDSTVEIQTND